MPRPPTPVKRYHQSLLETMSDIGRHQKWFTSPLNLGGVPGPGGGSGIPIGGLIGQLIQSKVAYDTTEAEILSPPPSGLSLVDNLNTIRFRLLFLEDHSSSALIVKEEGVQRASGVVIMNFQGGVNVTSPQPNTVNVIVTATGGGSVLGGVTVVFEDLTSQIPAMDEFYVVSQPIVSGSSQVFMNGLHQVPTYYTETSSGVKLTETLTATDELLIQYLTSGATAVGLKIFDTGVFQASGVTEINFIGAESITVSGTRVNVTFSGGAGGGGPHLLGSTTHTDVVITSEGDNDILAYDSGSTDWINQTAAEANLATAGHAHADVVDVSADDTTAGFLEDKIVAGSNIEITVLNEAGDEDLQIAASGLSISGHVHVEADITDLLHDTVLVSSNDTTEGFLEDKIVAGANITITTLDEGANETLEITSTGSGGGSALEVQDEGVTLTSGVTLLDFVGGGVTATAVGNAVTVTIPSGVGGEGEIDFGDWIDADLEWWSGSTEAALDPTSWSKYSHVGRTVHIMAYLVSDDNVGASTQTIRNLPVPVDAILTAGTAEIGRARHRDQGTAFIDLFPFADGTTSTTLNLNEHESFTQYSNAIDVDDSMLLNATYYAASGAIVPGGGGSTYTFFDINKPKITADTPDDEFGAATLDAKWTVVSGSSGTVDFLETANVSEYDLTTRPGNLLMQVGQTGAQEVSFRQDYTLPDGKSIILAFTPILMVDADGGGINNNELQMGISLNPSDTDHDDGDEQEIFFDANANGWRVFHAGNGLAVAGTPNGAMPDMQKMYLRISRASSVYYASYSMDGTAWAPMGSHTPGATQTNLWIWTRSSAAFGDPIPIQVFDWIRLGDNTLDPWETQVTVGGADKKVTIFTVEGEVPTASGTLRMYNKWGRSISISNVFTAVNTAPSGLALIVDINKDGTSIFTDQSKRPLIVSGAFTDTSDAPDTQAWASDSYLTMDVDQVGSTVAGSDLTVHVVGE